MSIGVVDRKLLWGRAGNRCAWPTCDQRLTVDLRTPESSILRDHGAILGQEAHIKSSRVDGPRHDPDYPLELLDTYANLVLLCPNHHVVIDKESGAAWPTGQVVDLKANHERSVDRESQTSDRLTQREDELLAARLALWEERADLQGWQFFTARLNSPIPRLGTDKQHELFELGSWLLSLAWPERYPRIHAAFENQRTVLAVLLQHFMQAGNIQGDWYEIAREYKTIPWDPPLYEKLMEKFNLNCDVTWWLALELTRATNLIITAVLSEFDPLYRFSEGFVLMADGDGVFTRSVARAAYESYVWADIPYPRTYDDVLTALSTARKDGEDVDLRSLAIISSARDHEKETP